MQVSADEIKWMSIPDKVFASIDEVVRSREKQVAQLPGKQTILKESARKCIVRNVRAVAADSTTGARAGFVLSFDPKIRAAPYRLTTEATVVELYTRANATVPITLLRSTQGYPVAARTLEQQKLLPDMKVRSVEGSHHVHVDYPERVMPHILDALGLHGPSSKL